MKHKILLKKYSIQPKKSLAQNFLTNKNIVQKTILAAELSKNDVVIEVGAGCGALTVSLAKQAGKVIAYEIDQRLISILKKQTADLENVEIRNQDIFNFDSKELKKQINFKVIGNFPYYLTGKIFRYFLSARKKPDLILAIIQSEVAKRICAPAGKTSVLSLSVQFYGKPKIITYIPAACFYPKPAVDSALVKVKINPKIGSALNSDKFFVLIKAGFASRRKTLINNLSRLAKKEYWSDLFKKLNWRQKIRAQELTLKQWLKLTKISTF